MIGTANYDESSNTSGSRGNPNPGALLKLKLKVQRNPPFVCARCKRTFPTIYALGGHQNAHRKERNEERWAYMEERRRKKPKGTAPILRRTPSMVVNAPSDGQVVEFLATPGPSHGPMPWFEPSGSNHESLNVQGMGRDCLAVANNNELVEDNGLLWGIPHGASYDNQNYLMYSYKQQSMPDEEQDLCIEKDFLGLMLGRQGAGWLREFPQDATDKNEASRAFDGAQIDQVTSKRDLDLTLRL